MQIRLKLILPDALEALAKSKPGEIAAAIKKPSCAPFAAT